MARSTSVSEDAYQYKATAGTRLYTHQTQGMLSSIHQHSHGSCMRLPPLMPAVQHAWGPWLMNGKASSCPQVVVPGYQQAQGQGVSVTSLQVAPRLQHAAE